jgi:O-acetyl-ADP-ribose deacetylase (regulator of RNase III)
LNFEHTYKNVKITVILGDITQQQTDAIVNPANSLLIMGGGVAGAIKRVGGKQIEEEALKHAPLPVGKAIATTAGKLKAKHVIHVPTMERPAMAIGKDNIRLAMNGALKCAEEKRIRSIAFPGLGTGVGGVSPEEAAEIMISVLREHINEGTRLKEVVFVGFERELADAFMRNVEEIFA